MFTKISNTWSSSYPLFDITKNVVHEVIPLHGLIDSWMWWFCSWSLMIPIILISPLINAFLLIMSLIFISFILLILLMVLCGWSSIIWGIRFTWILWSYISNCYLLQGFTRSFFIIYNIKKLLHLGAISLIKHHITCGFNTTGVLVEKTICAWVWVIAKQETFIYFRSKFWRPWPLLKNITLASKDCKVRDVWLVAG
jgi:hypothetical protein